MALWDDAELTINAYVNKKAHEVAERMRTEITLAANKGYATGTLADSVEISKSSRWEWEIRPTATNNGFPYGKVLNSGRKAFSSKGKTLKFKGKNGETVYTNHVSGVTGTNFLRKTVQKYK